MGDARSQIYQFGEFRLDAAKRMLTNRKNQEVPLTPKAFDTLLYLVQHGGTVLDKEELMQMIWPDTVVEENNLSQNISTLRRVLGESRGEHRYIVTVPGRGYRFVADVKMSPAETATSSASSTKTIAVLPFKPMVEEHRDAALEMGMADTLIARLSSSEMIVRPISSVRRYGDLDQDPLAAGRELGAGFVLDGSIQRWGDQIRVNARLVDVDSGLSLWAGTFDRKFRDIFDIQDEISLAIVDALMVKLLGREKTAVLKRSTDNTEAYELYLKGRYFWFQFNQEGITRAGDCFEQALQKDPNFALAHSGRADALSASAVFRPPKEVFPKAEDSALQALKLDPSMAEAWVSRAAVRLFYEWDWAGAESDCKQSIELNPRYVLARDLYSLCLLTQGRFDEAIHEARTARELDPLSGYINASLGFVLYYSRRYDEAINQLLKAAELDHGSIWSLTPLVDFYEQKAMYREALNHRQKLLALAGNHDLAAEIAHEFRRSGYEGVLLRWLDELHKQSKLRYVSPLEFAKTYVRLGEQEQALDWLEEAFEGRALYLNFLGVGPVWESLHVNARYAGLLRRIGLTY